MYSQTGNLPFVCIVLMFWYASCQNPIVDCQSKIAHADERRFKVPDPKKDIGQTKNVSVAPLPQKNAIAPQADTNSEHEERLLDEALEETFPASDPITELPVKSPEGAEPLSAEEEERLHEEHLLDEALEETFPASDPIAVHVPDRIPLSSPSQPAR